MTFDVVVAGGGPGGSTTAARLAQKGRRVLVLERDDFPRFHLGESLLPDSVAILDALGVLPEVDARFIRKPGAVFHDSYTDRVARFDFSDAFAPKSPYAYQVPRDEFDALLLENAARLGAEVRHRWSVERVRFDEAHRVVGVDATDPRGERHAIDAPVFVDATGRDALLAREAHATERIGGLENTALFSQWRGVHRVEGPEAGDFHLVLFGDDDADNRKSVTPRPLGWFWLIPFKDGRTSVGASASRAWVRRHPGEDAPALYARAIAETPGARRFLEGAEQLWPARATADYSFKVRDLAGDGWLAVGDAGGFIDPLFSTGAHLAMYGGFHGADAIDAALAAGDVSRARFLPWEAQMRSGGTMFLEMVESFYDGVLSRLFFVDRPHPYVRRVITSLLAGNVFGSEVRWLEEARTRMSRPALMKLLTGS
ncbi:MAG: NAD(P)/FAD-dependent oxidoreductase [Polyangiaceae bacterium]